MVHCDYLQAKVLASKVKSEEDTPQCPHYCKWWVWPFAEITVGLWVVLESLGIDLWIIPFGWVGLDVINITTCKDGLKN